MDWNDKIILLTGGTGSFGQKFTEIMLSRYRPKIIRIFSRDELKQWEMQRKFNNDSRLRFFIGDIRDRKRLEMAFEDVDIVVHAAALKHVPVCEYNPFEAIKTNVMGAQNIIEAALSHNVDKVIALSTDKAVNPVNLYGATKMCMEKLFISANSYVGPKRQTRMSCVRYGNVVGSRGSIVPLLKQQKETGTVTITDNRMTRFWLTLDQAVALVLKALDNMRGGEVFIPKIPSMRIPDLVAALAPECAVNHIGIRPGEKLHECLITEDEARHATEFDDHFVVEPERPQWERELIEGGKPLPEGFRYTSDNNTVWLRPDELAAMIK